MIQGFQQYKRADKIRNLLQSCAYLQQAALVCVPCGKWFTGIIIFPWTLAKGNALFDVVSDSFLFIFYIFRSCLLFWNSFNLSRFLSLSDISFLRNALLHFFLSLFDRASKPACAAEAGQWTFLSLLCFDSLQFLFYFSPFFVCFQHLVLGVLRGLSFHSFIYSFQGW